MSSWTWPVKIKHKTRSLNCFSLAVSFLEVLRKFPSTKRNQLVEKVRQILPIPVFVWAKLFAPDHVTRTKYWGIRAKQIFIHGLLKDRQKILIFTAVEFLRCDIIIDLCKARFKRRMLHAPNIIKKIESTHINKFGWFDLNVAFFAPNKIAEAERPVHSRTPIQDFTNAANNNKEHIMRLDRLRLSGRDDL